ncbi:alpha/beta hydrolase [Streptomyces sp. NPDC002730]|uniref:alpha/beta hydrolase n=1 Tax=Streptomyces sp. NPDC002730 TaxID=3364662 RepID=UPI0036823C07
MTTWQELEKLNTKEYEDAADGWGTVSSRANAAKDRVDNEMLAKLRETQKGHTATAAIGDLAQLSRNYQYIHTECGLIRTALNGLASELAGPQKRLKDALAEAPKTFTVNPDGSVEYPVSPSFLKVPASGSGTASPGAPVPLLPGKAEGGSDANKALAEQIAENIATALREAKEIDGRYAGILRKLKIPDGVKGLDITDAMFIDAAQDTKNLRKASKYREESEIPKGKSPAHNAGWWKGLSQEQRDEYTTLYPASIGALDGLPATVRDDANRMVFAETRATYQVELNAIPPEPPKYAKHPGHGRTVRSEEWKEWNDKYGEKIERLDNSLEGMKSIQQRFDSTGTNGLPEAYLLGFSAEGTGRAIVANGNPDTADHTAVYAPGTTSNLGSIEGDINRMTQLWRTSDGMEGSGNVSTITWLGYDAPQSIVKDSPFRHYADDGAPAYNRFMDGLETAQGGPDKSHTTVIGHSYGTTLVGAAARQGDLSADDVIFAGSPGVQVGSAQEMDVPKGHVWNEDAKGDPVPSLGSWGHGGSQEGGPHFIIPSDNIFGANQMSTDTEGHSDYWKKDSQSLMNQAAVVTGNYGAVQQLEPESVWRGPQR